MFLPVFLWFVVHCVTIILKRVIHRQPLHTSCAKSPHERATMYRTNATVDNVMLQILKEMQRQRRVDQERLQEQRRAHQERLQKLEEQRIPSNRKTSSRYAENVPGASGWTDATGSDYYGFCRRYPRRPQYWNFCKRWHGSSVER